MKYFVIGISILAVIGLFFTVSKPADQATQEVSKSSYATIETALQSGANLYDVRTPEEFTESHVVTAENFPLTTMETGILPTIPKDETVYVYCRSGNRSAQAAAILRNAGFTNIIDLGGVDDMKKLGATFTN